jgi:hypothetical protein
LRERCDSSFDLRKAIVEHDVFVATRQLEDYGRLGDVRAVWFLGFFPRGFHLEEYTLLGF